MSDLGPDGRPDSTTTGRVFVPEPSGGPRQAMRASGGTGGREPSVSGGVLPVRDDGVSPGDIVIDVVYAGPDLGRVADLTGLSAEAVVAAHTSTPWQVEYCGFAPGFAYLTGGDPRLVVPRLDTPRPEVPCGAVGLAGEYSGIYPRPSPGGWNLIGGTDAVLWDLDRDPPALLRTGMTVRFRAVREHVDATGTARGARAGAASESTARAVSGDAGVADAPRLGPAIAVVSPGMLCLVEDLGRDGYTDMGVSPSGAADRGAAIRANRLVGNPDGAAVLELLLGGAILRAEETVTLAVTGAALPLSVTPARESDSAATSSEERAEAEPVPAKPAARESFTASMDAAFALPAGATLRLGRPKRALRTYVSVRGGIDVPPVLGSRSTDTLSGLGPPPVAAGSRLPVGSGQRITPGAEPSDDGNRSFVPAGDAVHGTPVVISADHGEAGLDAVERPGAMGAIPAAGDEHDATPVVISADHGEVGGSPGGKPGASSATRPTTEVEHDGARSVIPDPGRDARRPSYGESRDGPTDVDATPGPQQDWFDDDALTLLREQSWTVSPRSNRVGVRLQGAALRRAVDAEMRIQPLMRGAIQVPPSGEPIIFLADHPVTGGYPVIAVLTDESVDRLAQARPGGSVRIHLR